MATFDLEPYLDRLGYTGPRTATVATLRALHLLHPLALPFENLDVLLQRPISLPLEALTDKLIYGGRGGYCYEHNLLFGAALGALGFEVRGLAARVVWNDPSGRINPRTHMLLRVIAEGEPWLVDVGFGGRTQTAPLRAVPDLAQETPHERFRLVQLEGDELCMEAEVQGSFRPLYRFDLQPQHLPDYELASYWVSTHPSSRFVQGLLAARVTRDRRYALLNNAFTTHHLHGTSERRVITDADELRAVLAGPFGIRLPEGPALDALLARLVQTLATA